MQERSIMGSKENGVDLLNALLDVERDAIEAYRAAAQRLAEPRDRARIVGFMEDHLRHVEELSALVRGASGEPARRGDVKQILARGKVVILSLLGDRLVLEAMKANESDVLTAYEGAIERADLPDNIRAVLRRNLAGERRHVDWIVDRLDAAEGLLRL
jgi:uncharacterized protein (TIGR02284 family)